jgi:3-oxoacyl-[acyl-carrier protein] reductase
MTPGVQGKIIIVTGASRGIGRAVALRLAEEGARLALCARNDEALQVTVDEIQAHSKTDVMSMKANMTRINDIHRFVNAAVKKYGRIDTLINNAGGAHIGGIAQTTDEAWEEHIQMKLLGYIRMAREVIPHMKIGNAGGRIINIIGTAGLEPSPLMMVPGVTNAALLNFTKSCSKELEPDGITVNAVCPGTVDTQLTVETFAQMGEILHKSPDDIRKTMEELSPKKRLATAEEIAGAVLFLASDAAGYINGASITIDAGKVSRMP